MSGEVGWAAGNSNSKPDRANLKERAVTYRFEVPMHYHGTPCVQIFETFNGIVGLSFELKLERSVTLELCHSEIHATYEFQSFLRTEVFTLEIVFEITVLHVWRDKICRIIVFSKIVPGECEDIFMV